MDARLCLALQFVENASLQALFEIIGRLVIVKYGKRLVHTHFNIRDLTKFLQ